jgi:A/G-specific adenine glycosylase
MTEVPGTAWTHDYDRRAALGDAPFPRAAWRKRPGVVRHVFTHFPLELDVFTATVKASAKAPKGARWVKLSEAQAEALPTVMRKVLSAALDAPSTAGAR